MVFIFHYLLTAKGIHTQCLLRHPIDSSVTPSIEKDASSSQVSVMDCFYIINDVIKVTLRCTNDTS